MKIISICENVLYKNRKTQKLIKKLEKMYKKDKNLILLIIPESAPKITNKLSLPTTEASKKELTMLLAHNHSLNASMLAYKLCIESMPSKSINAHELELEAKGDTYNPIITNINTSIINKFLKEDIICVIPAGVVKNSNKELIYFYKPTALSHALSIIFEQKPIDLII